MFEQKGPFQVPSKQMVKNIDEELKNSLLRLQKTNEESKKIKERLAIQKEFLKIYPRGPKIKEAVENYLAGKIDLKGNIINSSKTKIIEIPIKEMPEKKKRSSKEEAAEAREKEAVDKENLKAELKQIVYDMYMKGSITSSYSTELRNLIDKGKMTKSNLMKKIHAHKMSYGNMDPEERGRSPSPEPTPKRGRPKKEKSPERSKSPEPKPKTKKKIDFNSMTPEQVKNIMKLKDMTMALQLNKGAPDSVAKKLNSQITKGTIETVAEFNKVSKELMEEESKKPKEIKKTSGKTLKQYMDERLGEEEPVKTTIKVKEETPSSIVKSSKTLKDALKQPVKQLDIMTATVKAKLDAHDKVMIDTYLKLRKDLTAKEKSAIRLSIQNEINEKMKGSGLSHPMHQIYGYGVNRTEDALEYFQHVKRLFGKI